MKCTSGLLCLLFVAVLMSSGAVYFLVFSNNPSPGHGRVFHKHAICTLGLAGRTYTIHVHVRLFSVVDEIIKTAWIVEHIHRRNLHGFLNLPVCVCLEELYPMAILYSTYLNYPYFMDSGQFVLFKWNFAEVCLLWCSMVAGDKL